MRLYFVDTPEEERVYADRIADQAAYFGITPDAAIQIGREASQFTKQALTKPVGVGAASQPLIPAGERSGLQPHIATTFVELESAIRAAAIRIQTNESCDR